MFIGAEDPFIPVSQMSDMTDLIRKQGVRVIWLSLRERGMVGAKHLQCRLFWRCS